MSAPAPGPEDPTLRRFLERHPELRESVHQVLSRATAVRDAKTRAFEGGIPEPVRGPSSLRCHEEFVSAITELEGLTRDGAPAPRATQATIGRVMRAAMALRVDSRAFSPRRETTSPTNRAALLRALAAFGHAFSSLERQARAAHVQRLPWQIELATHVAPDTPVAAMEISGYDLARTPAALRPWGERCALTGTPFNTDRHRSPAMRYRSLDTQDRVLAPEAFGLLHRLRRALDSIAALRPEAVKGISRLLPLYDEFVAEPCHPTFARLGLLDFPSLAVSLNNMLLRYAERPLFGRRGAHGQYRTLGMLDAEAICAKDATSGYVWDTYDDVRTLSLHLAHGLEQLGLRPGAKLGILASENCREFYLADFAAVFSGLVSVGLQTNLSDEQLGVAARQAQLDAVVADGPSAMRFLDPALLRQCPSLRWLVVFDSATEPGARPESPRLVKMEELLARAPEPAWASAAGISLDTEILYGDMPGHRKARERDIPEDKDDDLYAIVFTSGSTGRPKGTMVSRRRWAEEMCCDDDLWPHVAVSFQPSAIAADRGLVWQALYNGGRVGFARRGAKLFEDVRAVRPTKFDVPPVIWNAIYAEYKRAVREPGLTRRQVAGLRRRFRSFLGGRVAFMGTGGAPSDAGVRKTMETLFGLPMSEGYGTTETGRIAVGGVLIAGLDWRLVDRPELGFIRQHEPFPRGELAVRTPRTTTRYCNDKESSRAGFTEEGYFLTGDLVEIESGERCRILGRRNDVFKLAGAEFVSPQLLERHYLASERVEALLVSGSPTQACVVAVVVPSRDDVTEAELLAELRAIATRKGLRACDVPAGVILEPRTAGGMPWTVANGLLTPSHKLNRPALQDRYREQIDALYVGSQRTRAESLAAETFEAHDLDACTRSLARVAAVILSREANDIVLEQSFLGNGGDSLTSMDFMLRLEQVFAGKGAPGEVWSAEPGELIDVPLGELAHRLADRQPGLAAGAPLGTPRAAGTAATVQSDPPEKTQIAPGQEPATREQAASAKDIVDLANTDADSAPRLTPGTAQAQPGPVLLTGANGFLGIHLLHQLVAGPEPETQVYALVRARDHAQARQRLVQAFEGARLPVPSIALPGAGVRGSVVALAGSLGDDDEHMGLPIDLWAQLARTVGLIYHVAAQVGGGLSYEKLRGPNVIGTRHVLEFATTTTLKALHFVSSLNVALLLQQRADPHVFEETPLLAHLPADTFNTHPHYGVTKWVGERMVQGLFAQAGGALRVSVSRPALLTWAQATGVANNQDWLSRVLSSCLQLRAAIGSDEVGIPQWAAETVTSARGLDMVPVDFVARAITRLGHLTQAGTLPPPTRPGAEDQVPTFHVSNLAAAEGGLVTIQRLMDMLVAADLRVNAHNAAPLEYLPRAAWLLEAELQATPALPLVGQLRNMQPALARTRAARFATAMAGEPCPAIDQELVDTYVRHWQSFRTKRPSPLGAE